MNKVKFRQVWACASEHWVRSLGFMREHSPIQLVKGGGGQTFCLLKFPVLNFVQRQSQNIVQIFSRIIDFPDHDSILDKGFVLLDVAVFGESLD